MYISSNYFWDHRKEAIGHNEILNEIQLLKEQISKIKEKKNMNSTKTPIPVSLNKLFFTKNLDSVSEIMRNQEK